MKKQVRRSPHNVKRLKAAKTSTQVERLEDKAWYKKKLQDANEFMARVGLPKEFL